MGKVRLCVFFLVLFVQHQTTSAKPSFWSELFEMFSDCDSFDDDDDSSDSDTDDSKSDSTSSSDSKPIFNMTLPSSKNGITLIVEKRNGQVVVNVNSLGGSTSEDAPPEATTAATTAAAGTTTAAPTAAAGTTTAAPTTTAAKA